MKKFFTLAAVALMAASVNAQGTYTVQEGDAISSGQKITSVENITMTWSETESSWNAGKKVQNWVEADFVAYANGGTNGKFSEGKEPTGCLIKLEPQKAGSVTVGIQLSANKGLYIVNKEFAKVTGYTYNFPASEDATESQQLTTNDKGEDIIPENGKKSNGTVTFDVEAGGVYYVLATGTKAGFFGFKYTTGSTDISGITAEEANENAPVYNLAGQRANKNAKGILIQNGKKFIKK